MSLLGRRGVQRQDFCPFSSESSESFEESKTSSQSQQQVGHMCPRSVATALQELREEPCPSGPLAHREKTTGLPSVVAEGILGTKQENQLPLPPVLQTRIPKSRCQDGSAHSLHRATFQSLGNQCHSSLCYCLDEVMSTQTLSR